VAILTSLRVLSIWSKRMKLQWDLAFTYVQAVTAEDKGIRLAHKNGKANDKFLFIPDKKSQSWFFEQIAAVVKACRSTILGRALLIKP
jgi:vacuolar protein sorting-associated protein 13A/C